jgi:16S rRNA C1402 N4-methylase RsmH
VKSLKHLRLLETLSPSSTYQDSLNSLHLVISQDSLGDTIKYILQLEPFKGYGIAVNDELGQLEKAIPTLDKLLRPRWTIGIISFHSLEDRIVKKAFADNSGSTYDADLKVLTKRPVIADKHEIVSNPRARSAKLRVAVKIKN